MVRLSQTRLIYNYISGHYRTLYIIFTIIITYMRPLNQETNLGYQKKVGSVYISKRDSVDLILTTYSTSLSISHERIIWLSMNIMSIYRNCMDHNNNILSFNSICRYIRARYRRYIKIEISMTHLL